jgi:hypothetical protein
MNHPPFDRWLFDEDLGATELAALAEHVRVCESCRHLAESWQSVELELRSAGTARPVDGFALRWRARRAEERAGVSKWQGATALALVFGSSAALIAFRLLGEPPSLVDLTMWLSNAASLVGVTRTLQTVLWNVAGLPGNPWLSALPLVGMAGMALAASAALVGLWSFVVYRLAWRTAPVRPSV